LLGRIDDPRSVTIIGNIQILTVDVISDRPSNPLGTGIPHGDPNQVVVRIDDWLDLTGIV
jgi:hypothetical protein